MNNTTPTSYTRQQHAICLAIWLGLFAALAAIAITIGLTFGHS